MYIYFSFRNGVEIADDDVTYDITENGKELSVLSADIEDQARFTCQAENAAGSAEKSFDLDVLGN